MVEIAKANERTMRNNAWDAARSGRNRGGQESRSRGSQRIGKFSSQARERERERYVHIMIVS